MSEVNIRVGQRVMVKECGGVVAYVGTTLFSPGKWYGVALDQPKGKNNGSVQGKTYFQCGPNHGVFVRQTQLTVLDGAVSQAPSSSPTSSPSADTTAAHSPRTPSSAAPSDKPKSRLPTMGTTAGTTPRASPAAASSSTATAARSKNMPARKSASSQDISRTSTVSSVAGAASQHVQPVTSAATTVPVLQSSASFVETNFVETGRTGGGGVVAGSSADTGGAGGDNAGNKKYVEEIANLRSEVTDLNEKLDTLKVKRAQDRDRLKEAEKLKIQLDQLQQFKREVLEQQSQLQRELVQARKDREEAVEAHHMLTDQTSDVRETLEMAALDKEMAEEKADVLLAELEQANEKIEELRVDLQLVQEELQSKNETTTGDSSLPHSALHDKQLLQQNERLKDALIKLRDISAHDKHELQRVQRSLDAATSSSAELQRERDKYAATVDKLEQDMAVLRENVDAALGAEHMVEQLTERNLAQEQQLSELHEHVSTLESLVDAGEEIAENSRELELELRHELDSAGVRALRLERERDAAHETIADHVTTIGKFRELVQRLQQSNESLSSQLHADTPHQHNIADKIDFQKMFAETKAHAKAVEMDLRKIEVQEANMHVKLVIGFLPEQFLARGGDYDCVLTLLLISRVSLKTDTLLASLRDKLPAVSVSVSQSPPDAHITADSSAVTEDTTTDESTSVQVEETPQALDTACFNSKLAYLLTCLQCVMGKYSHALSCTDVEHLLSVSAQYADMAAHEKSLDFYIQLMRDDQLGENTSLERLSCVLSHFSGVYNNSLSGAPLHHFNFLVSMARASGAACCSIQHDSRRLKAMCGGEAAVLFQWLSNSAESVQMLTKRILRQLPADSSAQRLSYSQQVYEDLSLVLQQLGRVCAALYDTTSAVYPIFKQATDGETRCDEVRVMQLLSRAVDVRQCAATTSDEDDAATVLRACITHLTDLLHVFAGKLQNGEYDYDGSGPDNNHAESTPPIEVRMRAVRAELSEAAGFRQRLSARDEELHQARLLVKMKQTELSEMNVRRELAEKKLSGSSRDADLTIEKLQRKLDDSGALLQRRQREFDDTMNQLQADLESLELERGELKDKLKQINKKALIDGLSKSAAAAAAGSVNLPLDSAGVMVDAAAGGECAWLQRELVALRDVVSRQRRQISKLHAQHAHHQLVQLAPIKVGGCLSKCSEQYKQLDSRCSQLINEISSSNLPALPPHLAATSDAATRRHHLLSSCTVARRCNERVLTADLQRLQRDVRQYVMRTVEGGCVTPSLTLFPSTALTQKLVSGEPSAVCSVRVSRQTSTTEPAGVTAGVTAGVVEEVGSASLVQLHRCMMQLIESAV